MTCPVPVTFRVAVAGLNQVTCYRMKVSLPVRPSGYGPPQNREASSCTTVP